MPIQTTTIGAYPKPEYVPISDWFQQESTIAEDPTRALDESDETSGPEVEKLLDRATVEVVREQTELGIDVVTDGEVRRENYIHYHCRNMAGFNFSRLTPKSMRDGQWLVSVPTIDGPVRAGAEFLVRDWQIAQAATNRPVKITIPGPLTIIDSTFDAYYGDERQLAADLAVAINREVLRLTDKGCCWIQIDEPIFARKAKEALAYGIENLERCFHNVPDQVDRSVHICCGYPDRVDSIDYLKAPPESYILLAPTLDSAAIDAISIEDAHRPTDLKLLELFAHKTIILGVIGIARSHIESVEDIASRLKEALLHIDPNRLIAAPDCGLGMLNRDQVRIKLKNMVDAARIC
ncbi:MAG: 5-methyltetrahydropteroyltriglutamate--homocysteine methyltransferase [Desulfobulbaceae bacterium S5133MH15]|nr:MAG: 5-methyltetrahydropteroyltriglutamate--homocysteine methyltransferase [Desulfobulbaceae bacterium S5133MH15]